MQQTHTDYLIVGQGIAGSVLALTLVNQGYNICVIDKPCLSLSSSVAAGIWNPVVFKRLAKTWMANEVVPLLIEFYTNFQTESKSHFVHHRPIIKAFADEQEINFWNKKSEQENDFLDKCIYSDLKLTTRTSIDFYSHVLQSGNIDVCVFLNEAKNYLRAIHHYHEEEFNFTKMSVNENSVSYKTFCAKHIIFCEGYLISNNPYFNYIPFKPAKGEILTIYSEDLNLSDAILNKGIFILPLGNSTYKVGATYDWENLSDIPTEIKKQELIFKLSLVLKTEFKILNHQAGVRPSVIDRRPVIGSHPNFKNVHVFNGFGTKAVMLAPYFAGQLVNYLTNNSSLLSEANVKRFESFFLKHNDFNQ